MLEHGFWTDELFDGWQICSLTIVDNFTRESLFAKANFRFKGIDVARALDEVMVFYGKPETIKVDNCPEIIEGSGSLAYSNG